MMTRHRAPFSPWRSPRFPSSPTTGCRQWSSERLRMTWAAMSRILLPRWCWIPRRPGYRFWRLRPVKSRGWNSPLGGNRESPCRRHIRAGCSRPHASTAGVWRQVEDCSRRHDSKVGVRRQAVGYSNTDMDCLTACLASSVTLLECFRRIIMM